MQPPLFTNSLAFLSTPSARRATCRPSRRFRDSRISIHALCEEGDGRPGRCFPADYGISIHALCEEGDWVAWTSDIDDYKFLSTPSARRATSAETAVSGDTHISIHALCEEGDFVPIPISGIEEEFLSTPSARRATMT